MRAFLFTDIEGSTRLWEELPHAMPGALARHDELLAEQVTTHAGHVLKTTGDGMIAVFGSSPDAISAALAGQRALRSEAWEETGPLRVRMAIHAGETEERDSDYFGPTMNRAARLMAAGHGGQILLSGAAAEGLNGSLPGAAELRDLGTHRLKDLTLPEHIYQLVHPELVTEFPPLLTLDSRPHNLPLQPTEFLGRESELAAIEIMLESPSTRLLTIAGPGGAGKTRLSLQVAANQIDRFPDGVFFVDLSAEREPNAAFEAVVRTLGLPDAREGSALHTLKLWFRDRRTLIVLDNLEQVTAMGPGLGELLLEAPELKVVVTSRETLRIRAERVYPIPPLTLPNPAHGSAIIGQAASVQLFAERARAVRPEFAVTDDNAATIAEICLRLDGLPLAIELAAARLNIFSPHDLLARLRDRLDVLGAGGRDLPDRQRTLWGAIGWSYELLEEADRQALAMVSVFSSARLDSLEVVAAEALGIDSILDVLSSLIDKSLVRTDDDGRFSMLQTIREYAAERLNEMPALADSIRAAHARHYSTFTHDLEGRLHGPDRQEAIDDLAGEIGNLRTAWRYWVERGDVGQLFNLLDGLWALLEAKGWYYAAIELATEMLGVLATTDERGERADEELTIRISLARALMAVKGYGVEVEEAFKSVLELAERTGSGARRFPVLRAMATYYMGVVENAKAAEIGRQLLELAEAEDSPSIRGEAHYVLGAADMFQGNLDEGLAHLDRAIELFEPEMHGAHRFRLGPNTAVVARVASGLMLWSRGSLDQGVARVTDALAVARRIDHPYTLAYALYHNGYLALGRDRFEECLALSRELAEVADRNEYPVWRTLASMLEGVSRAAMGETDEGLALTERAVDLYQGLTTPPVFWPLVLVLRARVHAMARKGGRALELVDQAAAIFGGYDDPIGTQALVIKGDVLRVQEDDPAAEDAYLSAIRSSRAAGVRLTELEAWTRLVALRRELGRAPDGSDGLEEAYAGFTEGFDEAPLRQARSLLG